MLEYSTQNRFFWVSFYEDGIVASSSTIILIFLGCAERSGISRTRTASTEMVSGRGGASTTPPPRTPAWASPGAPSWTRSDIKYRFVSALHCTPHQLFVILDDVHICSYTYPTVLHLWTYFYTLCRVRRSGLFNNLQLLL
jgi:hypothetical protein